MFPSSWTWICRQVKYMKWIITDQDDVANGVCGSQFLSYHIIFTQSDCFLRVYLKYWFRTEEIEVVWRIVYESKRANYTEALNVKALDLSCGTPSITLKMLSCAFCSDSKRCSWIVLDVVLKVSKPNQIAAVRRVVPSKRWVKQIQLRTFHSYSLKNIGTWSRFCWMNSASFKKNRLFNPLLITVYFGANIRDLRSWLTV